MAKIYTECGQYQEAIDELDYLLSITSGYSTNTLNFDDDFDPLRELPEFQALLKKYELNPGS